MECVFTLLRGSIVCWWETTSYKPPTMGGLHNRYSHRKQALQGAPCCSRDHFPRQQRWWTTPKATFIGLSCLHFRVNKASVVHNHPPKFLQGERETQQFHVVFLDNLSKHHFVYKKKKKKKCFLKLAGKYSQEATLFQNQLEGINIEYAMQKIKTSNVTLHLSPLKIMVP